MVDDIVHCSKLHMPCSSETDNLQLEFCGVLIASILLSGRLINACPRFILAKSQSFIRQVPGGMSLLCETSNGSPSRWQQPYFQSVG